MSAKNQVASTYQSVESRPHSAVTNYTNIGLSRQAEMHVKALLDQIGLIL